MKKTSKIGISQLLSIFGLLHISFLIFAVPADTLRINEKTDDLQILNGTQFLHDSTDLFDKASIYCQRFYDALKSPYAPDYYENGNLWVRFYLKNESTEDEEFILEVDAYAKIHVFYRSILDSEFKEKITGQYVPFPENEMGENTFRMNKVNLSLKPSVPYEVIVYYPKTGERIKTSLRVFSYERWVLNRFKRSENIKIFMGLFFGITLFLALVNFIYYFLHWQKAYIYYTFYIIALVYFEASIHGIFDKSQLIEFPLIYYLIESISLSLIIIFYFFFFKTFLNTRVRYPIWNKLINILIIGHCIGFFISFWLFGISKLPLTSLEIRNYYIIITLIIGIILLINLAIKGSRLDYIFLLGSAALFLTGIISIVVELFISKNNNPDLFFQIGIIVELITFSVGLRIKSRTIEQEKQEAQSQLIAQLKENEKLQLSINQDLEDQVHERTKEIKSQNEKLVNKQEELVQQQEELAAHRDLLEEQNRVIAKNMEELQEVKAQLEDTVESRTMELKNANLELVQQNNQLEQYAYITAHNLRGPVARLKGLMHILEMTKGAEIDEEIISRISNSALEMDEVITDMNTILELKNKRNGPINRINIAKAFEKSKNLLCNNIKECNATINLNLKTPEIHANEPYVQSIFYNLISNAIKYRDENRPLEINISSFIKDSQTVLEVSDNGMGIDLNKFGDQLFGLYKRFHDHVAGKGLGLHIVKTQVEALGGSIRAESEVARGTKFTLSFPIN